MSTLTQSQQIAQTSSDITAEQLLTEKFGNFVKWLEERKAHYPKIAPLHTKFAIFLGPDGIARFALFVKDNLKPWVAELDKFLDMVLLTHGIAKTDIEPADYDKLSRYLTLFCKLV